MFDELKEILVKELEVPENDITPSAEFINDLKLNSLEIADLVVFCEDKFEVEIDEEDLHSIITVQDLCDYMAQKV